MGAGVTYLDDRPAALTTAAFVASPFDTGELPAYTIAQFDIGYRLTPNLSAQLDIRNAFDSYYIESSNNDTRVTPGAPRTIRFTLRAEI